MAEGILWYDRSPTGLWHLFAEVHEGTAIVAIHDSRLALSDTIPAPDSVLGGRGSLEMRSIGWAISDEGRVAMGRATTQGYRILLYDRTGALSLEGGRDLPRIGGAEAEIVDPISRFWTFSAFAFDPAGRLWVRREQTSSDETVFDLFDSQLRFLDQIVVPGRVGSFDIGRSYVAAVVFREFAVPFVRVWRLAESQRAARN
jgi:hypothetical protein